MTKTYRFKVDKLICDKLPQLMRQFGISVFERVMEHEEYMRRLEEKLVEEAKEVLNAKTDQQRQEELADVLEVIYSLIEAHKITFEEIEAVRKDKKQHMAALREGFIMRLLNERRLPES